MAKIPENICTTKKSGDCLFCPIDFGQSDRYRITGSLMMLFPELC